MTAVSGLPSNSPTSTVVSSVLGKQFANIAASSRSAICRLVSTMKASTAHSETYGLKVQAASTGITLSDSLPALGAQPKSQRLTGGASIDQTSPSNPWSKLTVVSSHLLLVMLDLSWVAAVRPYLEGRAPRKRNEHGYMQFGLT